jgi:hypothetical protein
MKYRNCIKGLLAVAALVFTGATAHATETLTYTGTPFTTGDFAGSQVDISVTLPNSASYSGIVQYNPAIPVSSFNFTVVGYFSIAEANASSYGFSLDLVNGLPIDWSVSAQGQGPATYISSINDSSGYFTAYGDVGDYVENYTDSLYSTSPGWPYASSTGTWTILSGVSGVPEPATWAVMLLGLGGMGGVIRVRRSAKPVIA